MAVLVVPLPKWSEELFRALLSFFVLGFGSAKTLATCHNGDYPANTGTNAHANLQECPHRKIVTVVGVYAARSSLKSSDFNRSDRL